MNKKKVLIPVGVIALAVLVTAVLVAARPEVEPVEPKRVVPVVRAVDAVPRDVRVVIESHGTIEAKQQAEIVAEAGGRVVRADDSFGPGGYFRAGETMLQLDARDYRAAMANAEAVLAQSRTRLAREQAEAEIAAEEWRELGDGTPASPLLLRQPQIAEARASIEAAEAALAQARLNLSRTTIRAPFSGRVLRKMVDVGQYVPAGTPVATMFASDFAEVRLPVTSEDLGFLDMSALGSNGPRVVLTGELGGAERRWEGTIVRSTGQIDPQTRLASVIARIPSPFEADGGAFPLQVGLFVDAAIDGVVLEDVFTLPRSALRSESRLFLLEQGRLVIRKVGVIRTSEDEVLIGSGLAAGELVITSPIETPVEGMSLTISGDERSIDGEAVEEIR